MPPVCALISKIRPVGIGATGSEWISIVGIAKRFKAGSYTVANEYICGQLAQLLRLPAPPGMVLKADGEVFFVSAGFTGVGENLPPVEPAALCAADPRTATGIIVFDVWVVNRDRHCGNLAYRASTGQVHMYDHSHALFGANAGTGLETLMGASMTLAINGQIGARECLLDHLLTKDHLPYWLDRVSNLDEAMVRDIFSEANADLGLSPKEATDGCDYLIERKRALANIVNAGLGEFKGLRRTLL